MFFPMTGDGELDMPDDAVIVLVETRTEGGLERQRRPSGVWAEFVVDRYDEETGRSVYHDEQPH